MSHVVVATALPTSHAAPGSPNWKPYEGGLSPWGVIEHIMESADQVWLISTASHGGFYVGHAQRQLIPTVWRSFAERWAKGSGPGWFEQDVAAAAVLLSIPEIRRNYPESILAQYRALLNRQVQIGYCLTCEKTWGAVDGLCEACGGQMIREVRPS